MIASFVVVDFRQLNSLQPTIAILGNSFCCITTRVSVQQQRQPRADLRDRDRWSSFFSYPRLLHEKPSASERQCYIVMPAVPTANLILSQAGFAFTVLDALFDTGKQLAHARICVERRGDGSDRRVVVDVPGSFFNSPPTDDQRVGQSNLLLRRAAKIASFDDLNGKRTLFCTANRRACPGVCGQLAEPLGRLLKRHLRIGAAPTLRRRSCFQISDQQVAVNGQQVLFPQRIQVPRTTLRPAHFVVNCDPGMRQGSDGLSEHSRGQLMPRQISHLFGCAACVAAPSVLGPSPRKTREEVDQRLFFTRSIPHERTDLAVVSLAVTSSPQALSTDRLVPFLWKLRRVKTDHGIGLANCRANLTDEDVGQGGMVRRQRAKEHLKPDAFLIMPECDRLSISTLNIRREALKSRFRILLLFRTPETPKIRFGELLQMIQHSVENLRRHLSVFQQLAIPGCTSLIHRHPPSVAQAS